MNFNEKHLAYLRESGLSDDILKEHGFKSLSADQVAKQLKWKPGGVLSAGYWILYPKDGGGYYCDFFRIRLDRPYVFKNMKEKQGAYSSKQKEAKYLSPTGVGVHLYIPHPVWAVLNNINIPLFFTEGEKKALKATQEGFYTIGLAGVNGWSREKKLIQDFDWIKLEGRLVYIVFDSDKATNPQVQRAEIDFASALRVKGARIKIVNFSGETEGF